MSAARVFGAATAVAALTTLVTSGLAAQAAAQSSGQMAQSRLTGSQGGSCQFVRGFDCHYEARTRQNESGEEEVSLETVVLWRVPEEFLERRWSREAESAAHAAYRAFMRRVEDEGRMVAGGGSSGRYWTAIEKLDPRRRWERERGASMSRDSFWVADSAFEAPGADTVMVILVDGVYTPDGPPPRIDAVLTRPSSWLHTSVKRWTKGDTTFIVRPRLPSSDAWLSEVLLAIPEVRAFVERQGSP